MFPFKNSPSAKRWFLVFIKNGVELLVGGWNFDLECKYFDSVSLLSFVALKTEGSSYKDFKVTHFFMHKALIVYLLNKLFSPDVLWDLLF